MKKGVKNTAKVDGDGNITIQGISNSPITINTHDKEAFTQILNSHRENQEELLALIRSLENHLEEHVLDWIKPFSSFKKHLTPPPFRTDTFLGREDDLVALHKRLKQTDKPLLLVNGQGGIGKTSLAAHYYYRYQDQYQYMAWLLSEKDLRLALLRLERPLELSFDPTDSQEKRVNHILETLANLSQAKGSCLLVIDNANELKNLKKNYPLLSRLNNFHILLTTRIQSFQKAQSFAVGALDLEAATALFESHYPLHKQNEQ